MTNARATMLMTSRRCSTAHHSRVRAAPAHDAHTHTHTCMHTQTFACKSGDDSLRLSTRRGMHASADLQCDARRCGAVALMLRPSFLPRLVVQRTAVAAAVSSSAPSALAATPTTGAAATPANTNEPKGVFSHDIYRHSELAAPAPNNAVGAEDRSRGHGTAHGSSRSWW